MLRYSHRYKPLSLLLFPLLCLLSLACRCPGNGGEPSDAGDTGDTGEQAAAPVQEQPSDPIIYYQSEDFEAYPPGNFRAAQRRSHSFSVPSVADPPSPHPWQILGNDWGSSTVLPLFQATVVDRGCMHGSRCLRMAMAGGLIYGPPYHFAHLQIPLGYYHSGDASPRYAQWYFKFSGQREDIIFKFGLPDAVEINIYFPLEKEREVEGREGAQLIVIDPLASRRKRVPLTPSGALQPGVWYRIEAAISEVVSIRIYAGDAESPLPGSSFRTLGILRLNWRLIGGGLTIGRHPTGFEAPEDGKTVAEYIENYHFHIDDFSFSDDPAILKVGFGEEQAAVAEQAEKQAAAEGQAAVEE